MKKRLDLIIDILKQQGYVTVKYLTEQLHYSTATINRDLNILQKQKLIRRHYDGAELVENKGTPLIFRYHKMRPVKNLIGKRAAEFIADGDRIFVDASTTCQCIARYITNRKNLTVITCNMMLVTFLSEHGIKCICLGGEVIEIPYMLGGDDAVDRALSYRADKMFFSTGGFSKSGDIYDADSYFMLHKAMAQNSDKVFYLADHDKLGKEQSREIFDLSRADYVITDYRFNDDICEKFGKEKFILV